MPRRGIVAGAAASEGKTRMKKQVEYLQKLFYDIWNDFGSVYLLIKYSDRTIVGKRGFTEEEKKKGLVLVFNNQTCNQFQWDSDGNLSCVLAFGSRKEEVSIHHDDLFGVFSPDAGVQFLRTGVGEEKPAPEPEPEKSSSTESRDSTHVVSLNDFKKRKSGGPR